MVKNKTSNGRCSCFLIKYITRNVEIQQRPGFPTDAAIKKWGDNSKNEEIQTSF